MIRMNDKSASEYSKRTNIFEEELEKPTIFKDEAKLSIDYIPRILPHREEELVKLSNEFRVIIEHPFKASRKVLITGPVGTGKTAIAKSFGEMLKDSANKRNLNIHYHHINCRRNRTYSLILKSIILSFYSAIPSRGYSPEELLEILKDILIKEKRYLIVTLDELDYIVEKSPILYDLTRLMDENYNAYQYISFIIITKNATFLYNLDDSTSSTLQKTHLKLKKYNSQQLYDILNERSKEAFYENSISEDILEQIADSSAQYGDARYALELLRIAGGIANRNRDLKISPEHVRIAKAEIHPLIKQEILRDLTYNQKLLLLAIVRKLRHEETVYVEISDVENQYKLVAEEFDYEATAHTTNWNNIKDLEETFAIINTKVSGNNKRGRSTIISINDAPLELLEEKLVELLNSA
ncbi:MAG: ORC1-type DNA replication protein [Promethearchaeota archaeon]|nr:MAG: ORC1-type DNA replication protein [Candidatus Lokiarchaeota archaeon]